MKKIYILFILLSIYGCSKRITNKMKGKEVNSNSQNLLTFKKSSNNSFSSIKPYKILALMFGFLPGVSGNSQQNYCNGLLDSECEILKNKLKPIQNETLGSLDYKNLEIWDSPICNYEYSFDKEIQNMVNDDYGDYKILFSYPYSEVGKYINNLEDSLWNQFEANNSKPLPIKINFEKLNSYCNEFCNGTSVENYLKDEKNLTPNEISNFKKKSNFFIFNKFDRPSFLKNFNPSNIFQNFRKSGILITSNTHLFDRYELMTLRLNKNNDEKYYMCLIKGEQKIKNFISNKFTKKDTDLNIENIYTKFIEITENHNIKPEQGYHPIFLDIILDNIDKKFDNKYQFLKKLMNDWYERTLGSKSLDINISKNNFSDFLMKLAFNTYIRYTKDFKKFHGNHKPISEYKTFFEEDKKTDLYRISSPIEYLGSDKYRFFSDSVRNFFIANAIISDINRLGEVAIKKDDSLLLEIIAGMLDDKDSNGNKYWDKLQDEYKKYIMKSCSLDNKGKTIAINSATILNKYNNRIFANSNILKNSCLSIEGAVFRIGPNLENADLTNSNIKNTDLRGANLKNIDFTKTKNCNNILTDNPIDACKSNYLSFFFAGLLTIIAVISTYLFSNKMKNTVKNIKNNYIKENKNKSSQKQTNTQSHNINEEIDSISNEQFNLQAQNNNSKITTCSKCLKKCSNYFAKHCFSFLFNNPKQTS